MINEGLREVCTGEGAVGDYCSNKIQMSQDAEIRHIRDLRLCVQWEESAGKLLVEL